MVRFDILTSCIRMDNDDVLIDSVTDSGISIERLGFVADMITFLSSIFCLCILMSPTNQMILAYLMLMGFSSSLFGYINYFKDLGATISNKCLAHIISCVFVMGMIHVHVDKEFLVLSLILILFSHFMIKTSNCASSYRKRMYSLCFCANLSLIEHRSLKLLRFKVRILAFFGLSPLFWPIFKNNLRNSTF